jgi:hypothetical protein
MIGMLLPCSAARNRQMAAGFYADATSRLGTVSNEHYRNRQQHKSKQLRESKMFAEHKAGDECDADHAERQMKRGHLSAAVCAVSEPRGRNVENVLGQNQKPTCAEGRPEADVVSKPQVSEPRQRHQATRQKHKRGDKYCFHLSFSVGLVSGSISSNALETNSKFMPQARQNFCFVELCVPQSGQCMDDLDGEVSHV